MTVTPSSRAAGAAEVPAVVAPAPPLGLAAGPVPTFSVIIAAYQAARTVAEAVASALEQTAPPHEVIVCDDGSTDHPERALAPWRDRITLLTKANGGEASAKNRAARAATGDFVAILDADDLYAPHRLELLGRAAAQRPDLDILTTDAWLEIDGRPVRRCYEEGFVFAADDQRVGILETNFLFGLAAVRRERLLAIGGLDESLPFATDWDLWLRLILSGSRAGLVPEPLAHYRLHRGNLSSQRARMLEGRAAVLERSLAHQTLSPHEREVAARSLARFRRERVLVEARAAVQQGSEGARRLALKVALDPTQTPLSRMKGLATALVPGLAARRLAPRGVEITAGLRVDGATTATAPTGAEGARPSPASTGTRAGRPGP